MRPMSAALAVAAVKKNSLQPLRAKGSNMRAVYGRPTGREGVMEW